VVICNAGTVVEIVIDSDCVAVFAVGVVESVTFTVKVEEPAVVGVPEIVPVVESVKPAGKDPELMLQEYGAVPPVAASVVE
jgi:hypothetical protein